MMKTISKRLDAVINPVRNEMKLAQDQAIERIKKVIHKAEQEVDQDSRFLSPQQRYEQSLQELEQAEHHLLSALGSLVKALRYIAPQTSLFIDFAPLKDIKGTVLKQEPSDFNNKQRDLF